MTDGPRPGAGGEPPAPVVGSAVRDTARDRVGVVSGHEGPYLRLRPPDGGREWDADAGRVQLLTPAELLSARVAEANTRSRTGLDLSGSPGQPRNGFGGGARRGPAVSDGHREHLVPIHCPADAVAPRFPGTDDGPRCGGSRGDGACARCRCSSMCRNW